MTEMITDVIGWGLEFSIYSAKRFAWCVKHRVEYTSGWGTAGFIYYCPECHEELYDSTSRDLPVYQHKEAQG